MPNKKNTKINHLPFLSLSQRVLLVFLVVALTTVVGYYLYIINSSAIRTLEVSEIEREIDLLLLERSELEVQVAENRDLAQFSNDLVEDMKPLEIAGYLTLSTDLTFKDEVALLVE